MISPSTASERPDAMRLLFQHLGPAAVAEKCGNVETMIANGELDADAVWLARDGIGPTAAMIAAQVPGGGAVVWPPRGRPSLHDPAPILEQLTRDAMTWLRSRGCRLAQALLPAKDSALAAPLEGNGFVRLTTLLTLRHFLDLAVDEFGRAARLEMRSVDSVAQITLETTLLRTYSGSLDCPELNARRSAADILAGHRGTGPFDPGRWWVAYHEGEPVGVLLCNQTEVNVWDLAYLGIVPEARGRGFGRELVGHALLEAKAADMLMTTITVDERNHIARALYHKAGFEALDEQVVWLWLAQK